MYSILPVHINRHNLAINRTAKPALNCPFLEFISVKYYFIWEFATYWLLVIKYSDNTSGKLSCQLDTHDCHCHYCMDGSIPWGPVTQKYHYYMLYKRPPDKMSTKSIQFAVKHGPSQIYRIPLKNIRWQKTYLKWDDMLKTVLEWLCYL